MSHPRYTSKEIVERGEALYNQQIRAEVETGNEGKFLVLDIETGAYEVDEDELAAVQRAKANNSNAVLYIMRIGYATAYRLGGQAVPS
ncbi:MAG: hypothetical protein ACE10K_14320 [Rhodothermales bacterium]